MGFEEILRHSAIPFARACWAWVWYRGEYHWMRQAGQTIGVGQIEEVNNRQVCTVLILLVVLATSLVAIFSRPQPGPARVPLSYWLASRCGFGLLHASTEMRTVVCIVSTRSRRQPAMAFFSEP